jgi:hypothetical protein
VKPSIATVSPSRTTSAIASRIVATLLDVIAPSIEERPAGTLADARQRVPGKS